MFWRRLFNFLNVIIKRLIWNWFNPYDFTVIKLPSNRTKIVTTNCQLEIITNHKTLCGSAELTINSPHSKNWNGSQRNYGRTQIIPIDK